MSDPNADAYNSNFPKELDVDALDGEARTAIEVVLGLERQPCGNHTFIITKGNIHGYGHEDGKPDDQGRNWWLTIKCPECGYEYSHSHWSNLL